MEKNGSGLNEADVDRLFLPDDSPPKATPAKSKPDFKSLAAGERDDAVQEKPQLKSGEDLERILFGRSAAAKIMAHTTARQLELFPSDRSFRYGEKILQRVAKSLLVSERL